MSFFGRIRAFFAPRKAISFGKTGIAVSAEDLQSVPRLSQQESYRLAISKGVCPLCGLDDLLERKTVDNTTNLMCGNKYCMRQFNVTGTGSDAIVEVVDYSDFEKNSEDEYDKRHGGPWDRGSADSYYQRGKNPHYYVGGTYQSKLVEMADMTADELAAYNAGYDYNEKLGDRKEYF